jgi:hypothetical protein
MFIDDDFWSQFPVAHGPEGSLLWIAAPVLLAVVLPAMILLGCVVMERVRLGPGDR